MKTTGYNSAKSWGIVGACSIVNCLVTFPSRIGAILFVEFLDRYDTNRQKASLFIIISSVLRCIIGPFVGYLGEFFELRHLTVMGCCFASLGIGICYFAKDIVAVTIFFGFIYGTGFALGNTLIVQVIKPYFNRNVANANGVLNAGTCIGTFSTIPMFSILLNQYDVLGALLILSGVMMHGIPLAILLKDSKYKNVYASQEKKPNKKDQHHQPQKDKNCLTISTKKENIPSTQTTLKLMEPNKYPKKGKYTTTSIQSQVVQETVQCYEQQLASISYESLSSCKLEENIASKTNYRFNNGIQEVTLSPQIAALEKKSKLATYFKVLRVFKNLSYFVILVCECIHCYNEVFILTTVVDLSRDKGVDGSQEHFFPMFITVAETAGFLGLGWITDKGYLSVTNFLGICYLGMGVSCSCLVLAESFLTMMIATMSFGLCSSGISIAMPVLIYAFVEESKQSMAIASRLILYAPLSFTIAPMIGYFKDTFGSYNGALYLLSTVCTGSALLVSILLPYTAKCRNRNN